MAHLSLLIDLLHALPDFISGGGALRLDGPRASSSRSYIAHPRRPTRKGGPPSSDGVRLTTGARETRTHPPPNPSPPSCPALAAALAVSNACPTPPLAPCAQVMRVDAGGALKSFYLELGGASRASSATPRCAAHGPPSRFWPWRSRREAVASRRRSGPHARPAVWGASGVLIQIKLYIHVKIVSPCAPPT